MHFESVGAHILAERTEFMDNALHLHRALRYAWRSHAHGFHGSEPAKLEFAWFMAIALLPFLFRHRILAGGECEAIDVRDQIFGR